jgi:serine/threonine-protein kinase
MSAALWAWTRRGPATTSFAYRLALAFPNDTRINTSGPLTSFDISPDGKQLVYVGGSDRRLFIRRLDELLPRVLSNGPASSPHFSRDGQLVAFVVDYTLMKIPGTGGAATKVADRVALFSWSQSGDIVFTRGGGPRPELFRVRVEGGAVERLTPPPQPNETAYGSPCFLPDGDALLFTIVIAGRDSTELAAIRLSDRKIVRLGVGGISPLFLSSGQIISVGFNGDLRLTPFDAKQLRVTGPSETVLQNVLTKSATVAEIAVSSSGTLVYLPGQAARQIVEFDRSGHPRVITPMLRDFRFPRYSPDGRRIAVTIGQPPSMDVWVYSIASGTLSKLTTDGHSTTPVWSPDGRRVAWTVSGGANAGTWWRSWDGSDAPASLLPRSRGIVFSPKGDFFVANVGSPTVVTAVRLDSSRAQTPLMQAQAPNSAISPDGKWLAYVADETGSLEVYIRPLPGPGGHYPMSDGGGFEPMWSRNGTEIFYRASARLVVASIAMSPEPHVLRRDSLFALSAPFGLVAAQYDVSPDGQRILAPSSVADDSPPILIINWVDELRRRATSSKTP